MTTKASVLSHIQDLSYTKASSKSKALATKAKASVLRHIQDLSYIKVNAMSKALAIKAKVEALALTVKAVIKAMVKTFNICPRSTWSLRLASPQG